MTETPQTPAEAPAAQVPPAPPPFEFLGWPLTLGFIGASILISLTQGLAQGFVSVNISQIAGEVGATTTEASWLMAAFLIPRASLPLLLIKIRTQYGLRRFAEVAIITYLLVSIAALMISDLRSAVMVQFFAGMASAPLSTLAFLYMLEPLPPQWKMRLGLPMVLTFAMLGTPLARVISPALMSDTGWVSLHLLSLGMAAVALALVYLLPLKPTPHVKVIAPLDIVSFLLIAVGFGGLTVAFVMGATYWWTEAPWLGWTLVVSILSLMSAVVIELHRKAPLLDIRWIMSPAIVHLTVTLLIFRLILSEQSAGAPRMFQVLGVTQDQLVPLFSVIVVSSILGGLACIPFIKAENVPRFHVVALVLIAAGAWMDSHSTIDTRPHQMMLSQAMIAAAGSLFLAPAMLRGLMSALARGPNYILSFVIVFLSTQSLGGAIGSGVFSTLINHREAFHLEVLREQIPATSPMVTSAIAARVAAVSSQIADPMQARAQAVTMIGTDITNQAYVLAYNDLYLLTFLIACLALFALLLHMWRDWIVQRLEAWRSRPPPEAAPETPASAEPETATAKPAAS